MTDYTLGTGSGGTMMIRDTGSSVEFYIKSGSSATWVNGAGFSKTVNGASASGTYNYPTGANWLLVYSEAVSSSQDVNFSIAYSGTSGLGGPTSFTQHIDRAPAYTNPTPPGTSVDSITGNGARIVVTPPSNDGGIGIDAYEAYILSNNSWPYEGGNIVTSWNGGTFTTVSLQPGTYYLYTARCRNAAGLWSTWAPMGSFTTATVPAAPSGVTPSSITSTSIYTSFYGNSDGGMPIIRWELGYGTDPNTPQYIVTDSSGQLNVTGLSMGVVWYFWARGVNAVGNGPWGPRSSATTLRVPDAPSIVTLSSVTQISVHAAFTGNGNGGAAITAWQIGYGTDPNTPQYTIASTGSTDIGGLSPGKMWYFWARGYNSVGWGPYGARGSVKTIAGMRIEVAGVIKEAIPYVNDVNGNPKLAQPYVNNSAGVPKKSI